MKKKLIIKRLWKKKFFNENEKNYILRILIFKYLNI